MQGWCLRWRRTWGCASRPWTPQQRGCRNFRRLHYTIPCRDFPVNSLNSTITAAKSAEQTVEERQLHLLLLSPSSVSKQVTPVRRKFVVVYVPLCYMSSLHSALSVNWLRQITVTKQNGPV